MMRFTQEDLEANKKCQATAVKKIAKGKTKIVVCEQETAYRVKRFGDKKYLVEGGDASNAADYKTEQTEATEYLCRRCFEHKYLYAEKQIFAGECPTDYMRERESEYGRYLGKWTFRKFE